MRVILLATGFQKTMLPIVRHKPTPLMQIVDKPLIVHVIEFLIKNGFTSFDIVLSHLPHMIEKVLDDGTRWGATISYHLVRDPEKPFTVLRPMAQGWGDELVLLGSGDLLPHFQSGVLQGPHPNLPILFMLTANIWSGWGVLPASVLGSISSDTIEDQFAEAIQVPLKKETISPYLSTRSLIEFKNSNFIFLENPTKTGMLPTASYEIEPGIWLSNPVSIHPGIKIIPPIYIGKNTQIMENVQLGPNVIIENNCIVDIGSNINHSIICQRSYVGESLEISDSIVDRNMLINLPHETAIFIRDDFILSELSYPTLLAYPMDWIERGFAGLLFLLLSPIYLFLLLTCTLTKSPMLRLPAPEDASQWITFSWLSLKPKNGASPNHFQSYFQRLPALLNIFRGEAHFVGVSPRGVDDAEKLPADWQKLYLHSKVGLITLAALDGEERPDTDGTYAAEAYYATHMGLKLDLNLFIRWIRKKINL